MIEDFGTLPDGESVQRITIADGDLTASFLTYGATIQAVRIAGVPFSLCLGFQTLQEYLSGGRYFGAVVGRVANRIGHGSATIDGTAFTFDRNERGMHTLHGGAGGIGLRNWTVLDQTETSLDLRVVDADGFNGFPGTLTVTARYRIIDGKALEVALEATTDATTLCNLAPHPYFNLNGGGDARDQMLQINATGITAVDAEKIPTGKIDPVFGTDWDHRAAKRMVDTGLTYDHNFCLSHEQKPLRRVACLTGEQSGVSMQIETTEPGLQVYDGAGMETPYAGFALEPQCWPDAPNHIGFPSIVLRPGETSRQVSRFIFERR